MAMTKETAGYSSVNRGLLCRSCQYGQVMESEQGHTLIRCSSGTTAIIPFVVTKCSAFERKEPQRLYDTALNLKIEDGHVFVFNLRKGDYVRAFPDKRARRAEATVSRKSKVAATAVGFVATQEMNLRQE